MTDTAEMRELLESIAADIETAVGGGMSWISHSEAYDFANRIRGVKDRALPALLDEVERLTAERNEFEAGWSFERQRALAAEKRLAEAEKVIGELADTNANYRQAHDLKGDGSPEAGRAWDLMRRAYARARTFLGDRT